MRRSIPLLVLLVLSLPLVACGGGSSGGGNNDVVVVVVPVGNTNATGPGSLVDAVTNAPDGATIRMDDALSGTITLSAPILINKNLRIEGPTGNTVIVSGNNATQVFFVEVGATVFMSDFTISNGSSGYGAGLENRGNLTLTRVIFDSCTASGAGRGGALGNLGGTVLMVECTLQLCQAFNGGAITNDGGPLTCLRCVFLQNSTSGNSGGAIANTEASCRLQNCHFENNFTTGANRTGGAITSGSNTPSADSNLDIVHCSFIGNTATGPGGALAFFNGPGFASNLSVRGSVFAGNADDGTAPEIDLTNGTLLLATYNFLADGTGSGIVNGINNNFAGTTAAPLPPMLGPLQNNGGPTVSRVPLPGSALLDSVAGVACLDLDGQPLTTDQRGNPRAVGPGCDRGATEAP